MNWQQTHYPVVGNKLQEKSGEFD